MSTAEITAEAILQAEHRTSPEEYVRVIETLLDSEQFAAARQMAARAAELFSDNPWLSKANRVLNPRKAVSRPGKASDRQREFAWLREHSSDYRGQWVALVGDQLVTHSESFDDVLREVKARRLAERPLFHRVD